MRILLINPPAQNTAIEYPDEKGDSYLETEDFGVFPPLGLLYIIAYLEKHSPSHEIILKDCVAEKIPHTQLGKIVEEARPDVVGITSFTISMADVVMAARTVRKHAPNAHICLGGHHPIAFPFEAAQLAEFDSIVVGEGETAFTALVDALENKRDITAITGVYTGESIIRHRSSPSRDSRFLTNVMVPPAYIEDIDSLPFPARAHVAHIDFHSIVGVSGRLATIISSRGCPYRCTYCDVPYKRYRKRSIGNIVDEVEQCVAQGYKELHFYDDLFNITPGRVMEFCAEVEKRSLKFHWDFRGRVNSVTYESLEAAKKAGLRMISFGVETGSDEGLAAIKKKTTTAKVREVFGWCRKLGILTIADFMIGFPFEKDRDAIMRNVDFLISLDPDYAQFAVLTLYPNTELFNDAARLGLINPSRWSAFSLDPRPGFMVDHWEEHMDIHELVRTQKEAYRKFYMRPSYIMRSALRLTSWYEAKAKARGFLKLLGANPGRGRKAAAVD
ncbi:MAG: B12-binding domain-containing radical SAM protein [Nitrospinae bacterium]|nr:B12-binding domain-containing radical SAM protein [Nitrospinota bacterium]